MKTRLPQLCLILALVVLAPLTAQPVDTGGIARNFTLRERGTGRSVSLHDFAGKIIVLDFFAYWCPPCQVSSPELEQNVHRYYAGRGGNPNGIPVQVVEVNVEPGSPALTDQFVRQVGANLVLDDLQQIAYQQFVVGQNAIPRFVVINGVANSTTHRQWEVVRNALGWGGTVNVAAFRQWIDSVRAASSAAPSAAVPSIASQPVSQHVSPGAPAVFSVEIAPGLTGVAYQWKKDGVPIAGATGFSHRIANAATADMGFYSVAATSTAGTVESNAATLTVATAGGARPVNLSTRGFIPAGGDLTPGFVIVGDTPKTLLVRAVGPGLGAFGVAGSLANPQLEIVRQDGTAMGGNDDWSAADPEAVVQAGAAVGAFALARGSLDAATVATLPPGGYTVRVTGRAGTSGIALVEIYDVDPPTSRSRLVNVSARAHVGIGAAELVPGFVIAGTAPRQLLIRAVGPGLTQFGVDGILRDPQLAIVPLGKTFSIAESNDWGAAAPVRAAAEAAGAFALTEHTADAALLVRLPPGGYTVRVSGVGATTGTALVEIYDVER